MIRSNTGRALVLCLGSLAASGAWAGPEDAARAGAARAADMLKGNGAPAPAPTSPAPTSPASAASATVADLEAAERMVDSIKDRLPFTQRHLMFVTKKVESFRDTDKRPTNVFDKGEVLRSYVEPLGYGLKPGPDGSHALLLTMDFVIKTPSGKILAGQNAFDKVNITYANRYTPVFLNLSLNITGIEPGDYVLTYTLHDDTNGKTMSFDQPFVIKG